MRKELPEISYVPETDVIPLHSRFDGRLWGRNLPLLHGSRLRRWYENLSHRLVLEFSEGDAERALLVKEKEVAVRELKRQTSVDTDALREQEAGLPGIYMRRLLHPERAVLQQRPTVEFTIWDTYMMSLRKIPFLHPIIFFNSFVSPSSTRFVGVDFTQSRVTSTELVSGSGQKHPKEIILVNKSK